MTAAAPLHESTENHSALALLEPPESGDEADRFARLVAHVIALADGPIEPALIAPAALLLRDEHLVDLPGVTFGSNYDLDVRSFELERGYVRALNAGWLKLHARKVTAKQPFEAEGDPTGSARAQTLFALGREELIRLARHHLLSDSADRSGRAA